MPLASKCRFPLLVITVYIITLFIPSFAIATSDPFPESTTPPTVNDILSSTNNTYYCSPSGSNSTGDGSINNPWVDFIGANGTVGPGDIIYLRGGTYPAYSYVNFSRSQNILTVDGTTTAPIVITNYPGEIAKWNSVNETWSLTLDGNNQKLIGTNVGGQYGIQITGGISIRTNNVQVSGVEFIGGTSNGGDLNPAMLSVPLNEGCDNLLISHCYFHDSRHQSSANRMACIRFFRNSNSIVEYNIFSNNWELSDCASVYYKDNTHNSTIRYNKFINSEKGIQYITQNYVGDSHDGLSIYNNLFHNIKNSILFRNEYGPNIDVYNNVALAIPGDGAFFYYLNAEAVNAGNDHGEFWNNVIQGTGFAKGWHSNSSDPANLPDTFDYNLWESASDRNQPWGEQNFHANATTASTLGISYNNSTLTATADDDYPGRMQGRDGYDIGGFVFDGIQPPINKPNMPADFLFESK